MAWAKGDWAVSLAGREYTGGHLPSSRHHTSPNPSTTSTHSAPKKETKKEVRANIKELEIE